MKATSKSAAPGGSLHPGRRVDVVNHLRLKVTDCRAVVRSGCMKIKFLHTGNAIEYETVSDIGVCDQIITISLVSIFYSYL